MRHIPARLASLTSIVVPAVALALALLAFPGPAKAQSGIRLNSLGSNIFEVADLELDKSAGYEWKYSVEPAGAVRLADQSLKCPGGVNNACQLGMLFAVEKRVPSILTLRYVKPGGATMKTIRLSVTFLPEGSSVIKELP
ncbi:hypothetical protein dsx2_0887 [Desulfovibrio sp. X2]|uniref:hypothetical protein n=1 Tax=Desulfovibrio sp. X2 TaxID=941449 RepID=UPI000358EFDB|nr:hypothetical protein [Desulfovibrio sp. X2]EPR37541.1 hypothetical protein dsx2_0887 [Desulfovibrio sp. X2]